MSTAGNGGEDEAGGKQQEPEEEEEEQEQAYLRSLLTRPDIRITHGDPGLPLFSWPRRRRRPPNEP